MVPWRFLWSGIYQRPGRALLTLFSVVIGVATMLAVSISITTTRRAFQEMYQTLAGRRPWRCVRTGEKTSTSGCWRISTRRRGSRPRCPFCNATASCISAPSVPT